MLFFSRLPPTLGIDRACALLRNPSCAISQAAYLDGYGNQHTCRRVFLSQYSLSAHPAPGGFARSGERAERGMRPFPQF